MRAGTTTTMHLRHRAGMGCSLPQDPISSDLNSCIQGITGECLVFICHVCSAFVIWWYACSGQLLAVLFRYFDPYRVSVQFVVFAPPWHHHAVVSPSGRKLQLGTSGWADPSRIPLSKTDQWYHITKEMVANRPALILDFAMWKLHQQIPKGLHALCNQLLFCVCTCWN